MSTKTTKTQLKAPIDDHASALTRIIVMTRERDELLAACKAAERDTIIGDRTRRVYKLLKAAIARAEGRAQ